MSRRRLIFLALVALVQTAVVLSLALRHEVRLAEGRDLILDVRPIDPRDPLRGDYVILGYDIQTLPASVPVGEGLKGGREAWLVLTLDAAGHGTPQRVVASLPEGLAPDEVALRVLWQRSAREAGQTHRLDLPNLDRYFVPEGTGRPLEEAIRDGSVQALLRVAPDGDALLDSLIVDGRPWSPDR